MNYFNLKNLDKVVTLSSRLKSPARKIQHRSAYKSREHSLNVLGNNLFVVERVVVPNDKHFIKSLWQNVFLCHQEYYGQLFTRFIYSFINKVSSTKSITIQSKRHRKSFNSILSISKTGVNFSFC